MDFSFSEEQDATGDLADTILTDRSTHERLRELERSGEVRFDRSLWAEVAAAGLLGIAVPEPHGGAGLGLVELGRLLEAAGRTAAALPLWETLALGALPLARFASEAVAGEWLPRVVDGSAVLTAAWQEELDGSGPHHVATTAVPDGDGWRVSGTKVCVPAGLIADAVVLEATVDGEIALFLVPAGERVTAEALETTAATPEAHLHLDGAAAHLLARGDDAVQWAFERAVATQCALALGHAQAMVDLLAGYTKERKQFDVPIATFQAVGHRAADSYIDLEAIKLTTWQALSRLAEGLDASAEVSVAKFWVAWGGQRITLAAAHLHGGVGVDRDYPLARHFTRAKELELQLGGATRHLLRVGEVLAAG